MKKFLTLMTVFICFSVSAKSMDLFLKLGGVVPVKEFNSNEVSKNDFKPTISLELDQDLVIVDAGIGIAYNPRNDVSEFATVPVYGFIKYNIIPVGIKPYIVGKFGKSFTTDKKIDKDVDGELYYGVGLGAEIMDSLEAEVLYSVATLDGSKEDLKMLTLSIGYNFF